MARHPVECLVAIEGEATGPAKGALPTVWRNGTVPYPLGGILRTWPELSREERRLLNDLSRFIVTP